MDGWVLRLVAEPEFVAGWYALGAVGASMVLLRRGQAGDDWSRHRFAWAVTVFFLSLVGLLAFRGWAWKQREVPGSLRVRAHQVAVEWAASSSLGVLAASLVARGLALNPGQEWAMAIAASVACSGVMLETPLSSLSAPWLRPRARDWAVIALMPITGCAWVLTYHAVVAVVIGAQPVWHTPAFWGCFAVMVLLVYAGSLPAAWLLMRGGFLMEGSPSQSTRDVLSRYAGARRLSLLGVAALGSVAALVWLTQQATVGREARAELARIGLPHGARALSLVSDASPSSCAVMTSYSGSVVRSDAVVPSSSVLAALQEGLKENVGWAREALRRNDHRLVLVRCLDAAYRAAVVGAHVVPDSVFTTALRYVYLARYALQWGDLPSARRRLAAASRALRSAPGVDEPANSTTGLQAYRGALVLSTHGEPVGRVTNVDGDSVELGLVGPWHGATWPWSGDERQLKVHPRTLLFGPARPLGATVVVPNLSPTFR